MNGMNKNKTEDPRLTRLALLALRQGREVLPYLRDGIPGAHRKQTDALADSVERRDLFNPGVTDDLRDLVATLEHELADNLVVETMWSDHDCDVTGNTWTETIWTPETRQLAKLWDAFRELLEAIEVVLDWRNLERILDAERRPTSAL